MISEAMMQESLLVYLIIHPLSSILVAHFFQIILLFLKLGRMKSSDTCRSLSELKRRILALLRIPCFSVSRAPSLFSLRIILNLHQDLHYSWVSQIR